jgi:hypothetical protein
MKMEQSVPKCWHIKFRRQGITQKKTYNKSQYPFLAKHVDLYVQLCAAHSVQQHTGCTIDTDSVATHHFKVSKSTMEHGIHIKVHTVTKYG